MNGLHFLSFRRVLFLVLAFSLAMALFASKKIDVVPPEWFGNGEETEAVSSDNNGSTASFSRKNAVNLTEEVQEEAPTASAEPTASEEEKNETIPEIVNGEHRAYIKGSDGFFFPNRPLTRAEAAQILDNLFSDENEDGETGDISYSDIHEKDWYAPAVARTASYLPGYEDGSFQPQKVILTTELLAALSGALKLELPEKPEIESADDEDEEAKTAAAELAEAAWIEALQDFAAEQEWMTGEEPLPENMTRAETVQLLNRALHRSPDRERIDALKMDVFLDADPADPAYADILEAVLDHSYTQTEGESEVWSEEVLDFPKLSTGFHSSDGELYYVESDGTVLRDPGLMRLGSRSYLVSEENGRIYTDGALHLTDGRVVFSGEDGSILKNESWHDYRFDKDGFYTTGDAELDAFVEAVIEECSGDEMTPLEQLRACYDHVRGFRYLGRNAALPASVKTIPHDKAIGYAKKIFETGKGDCYNFAASFCFLARALGYDATAVVGKCGYVWSRSAIAHGWVEIVIDGEIFLFDPQIENYNDRNSISNDEHGAFCVTYETAPGRYYKN